MIGIGIVGAGRISGAHAQAARALPTTRLVGVAEPDEERRARFLERFGGTGYAEHRALLDADEVDAIVVCLPHWLHAEVGCAALDAGKHVFLEKPMAMTVAECDALIAAARRAGRKLMVGHMYQYHPVNTTAKALLDAGELGAIVMATDTWHKPFFGREKRPAWFLDAAKGGGMWPMNGSHMIDRMTYLIGSDVVAVKASVGTRFFDQPCTDHGVALLQYGNGTHATLVHAGYRDGCGAERHEAEITATEGQIKFDGKSLWRIRDGQYVPVEVTAMPPPLRPDAPCSPMFALQAAGFADAIRNDTAAPIPGEYGRQVVRVLEACEESGRTGREVRLD